MAASITVQRPMARTASRWPGLILTAAIVLTAVVATVSLAQDPAGRAAVESALLSPLGLLALFGISALANATLFLPVPGLALTAVAATVADPFTVALVAGAGQAAGESTGYLAGASGRAFMPEGPRLGRLVAWMRRRGTMTILVLATIPNPVFDVAGVLAGALRMRFVSFLAATAVGKFAKNLALVALTAGGTGLVAGTAT